MLGLFDKFQPKFVKQYANIGEQIRQGLVAYRDEVQTGEFPSNEHSFAIPEAEFEEFLRLVKRDESF
jgi:3-methyl-2-oxobutanoate hydroxymethyltransferase